MSFTLNHIRVKETWKARSTKSRGWEPSYSLCLPWRPSWSDVDLDTYSLLINSMLGFFFLSVLITTLLCFAQMWPDPRPILKLVLSEGYHKPLGTRFLGPAPGLPVHGGSVGWAGNGARLAWVKATKDKQPSTARKCLVSHELKCELRLLPLPSQLLLSAAKLWSFSFTFQNKNRWLCCLLSHLQPRLLGPGDVSRCSGLLPGPLCFPVFMVFSVTPVPILFELLLNAHPSVSPQSFVRRDAWRHHTSWKHSFSALASVFVQYFS